MAIGCVEDDTCTATVSVPPAGMLLRGQVMVTPLCPHTSPLLAATATAGALAFC
jgi:hypothetical protein